MKPEVWVPSLAALLSPLVPLLITGAARRRSRRGVLVRKTGPGRIWWIALALGAAATAALVWVVPSPWRWLVLGGYAALAAAAVLHARRRGRKVRPSPEAVAFLKQRMGYEAGYPYDRDFLPDLVRVYTKNDLTGTDEAGAASGQRRSGEPPQSSTTTFERLLMDPKVRHLAITGEAGTGKTSLLEYWRYELRLNGTGAREGLHRFVPLLIAARGLVGRASVAEAFGPDGPEALSRPPGAGMAWLVMIDAFDEITDPRARAEVERIVFAAIDEVPSEGAHAKYVITTRGLTDDRRRSLDTRGVAEFELQPFTAGQLREFLVREETSARDVAERNAAYEKAAAKVDRFLARWEGHDEILELIRLPLLARVTANIYFQDGRLEIPARRVDVYHDTIEHWIAQFHKRMRVEDEPFAPVLALLHEWHAAQGGPRDADAAVRALLRRLAVAYLESGQESVVSVARDLLGVPVRPEDPARTKALFTLLDATGLVHDVKAVDPRFLHKSYAEYLAAPDLFDEGDDPAAWDAALSDPDRRIGAVFALAQMSPDRRRRLIEELAADGRFPVSCGWIAAEGLCVEQGGGIDEEQRDRLTAACLRALPTFPTPEWLNLVEALAPIASACDRLAALVEERRISDWTLLTLARIMARQDPRGVDLLRRFATEDAFNHFLRVSAADDLMKEHDSAHGRALLLGFADDETLGGRVRVDALGWLVEYEPSQAVQRLRKLAVSPVQSPPTRAEAAALLAEHDAARGLRLARRYANDRTFGDQERVDLAVRLAKSQDPQGVALLRRFAADTAVEEDARVVAAGHLLEHDREAGRELLRGLAADPVHLHTTRVAATHYLAVHEDRSDLEEMLAFAQDQNLDDWARLQAARWIRVAEPETGRRLIEAFASLTTFDPEARVSAIDDLVDFDRPAALKRLRELAEDTGTGDEARVYAADWVATRDPRAGRPVLAALAEDRSLNGDAQAAAHRAMMNLDVTEGLRGLLRLIEDEEVGGAARVAAAADLAKVSRKRGRALLRGLADDPRLSDAERAAALTHWVASDRRANPARLREAAEDGRRRGMARIEAAQQLVRTHRAEGLRLLRSLYGDACLTDDERHDAAMFLIRYERDGGTDRLLSIAADCDFDESVRLQAIRGLTAYLPETGLPMLREFAADRSLPDSVAVSAAYWLALRSEGEGVPLLKAHAADPVFDDWARVDAAENLMEFDLLESLRLLREFGTDAEIDAPARVSALTRLAKHDRSAGVPLLRELAEARESPSLLTAMAAEGLLPFDRPRGVELLSALAQDEGSPGMVRAYAAAELSDCDRPAGRVLIRRFAEENVLGEAPRLIVLEALLGFDRPIGRPALLAIADDAGAAGLFRVAAAGLLAQDGDRDGLDRLRALATDRSLDGFDRALAAWDLSFLCKREGMAALTALRSDPEAGEALRCWVDIALAERDLALRESLVERYAHLDESDVGLLRRKAVDLSDLHQRRGARARSRVAAIAAARAGRSDRLEPDGAF